MSSFEDIFNGLHKHTSLKDNFSTAVEFVIEKKKTRSLGDIAKKIGVSPSSLSQYLSGNKEITPAVVLKFNKVFELDLNNPVTFTNDDWDMVFDASYPDIPAALYIKTYHVMRKRIETQSALLRSLGQANVDLIRSNVILNDIIQKMEPYVMKMVLNNATKK